MDYESLEQFGEKIKAELRAEYQAEHGQKEFWRIFYEENPGLRAHREVVGTVLAENMGNMADMSISDAAEFLADAARKRIRWLDETREQREEAAAYVGGPGLEDKPAPDQVFDRPESLGSMINKRREQRRSAQRGFVRAE